MAPTCCDIQCCRDVLGNFFTHPIVRKISEGLVCFLVVGGLLVVMFSFIVGGVGLVIILKGKWPVFSLGWWLWLASTWVYLLLAALLIVFVLLLVCAVICGCLYQVYRGCRWLVTSSDSCCVQPCADARRAADAREREALLPVTVVTPGQAPMIMAGSLNGNDCTPAITTSSSTP